VSTVMNLGVPWTGPTERLPAYQEWFWSLELVHVLCFKRPTGYDSYLWHILDFFCKANSSTNGPVTWNM